MIFVHSSHSTSFRISNKEQLKMNMKIIALLIIFIAISEARPNDRVEETIKSRLPELGSFEKDKEEIVGNFCKQNIAQLEKEILGIKNNSRIQLDHIQQNMKVGKNQNILDVKGTLKRIENTLGNIFDETHSV